MSSDTVLGDGSELRWSAAELQAQTAAWQQCLQQVGAQRVATLVDNHPHWVALDRAVRQVGVHIPLPPFFSPTQILHALQDSAADTLLTAQPAAFLAMGWQLREATCYAPWQMLTRTPAVRSELPKGTALITYTSGTTGTPKGVALSTAHLDIVAQSLVQAMASTGATRHLCLLPLGVLLEQVGGVLAAQSLPHGVSIIPPLARTGVQGAAGVDGWQLARILGESEAHSAIFLPQMLRALSSALRAGAPFPSAVRMLAIGGAKVGMALLEDAAELGLPVFEGYGLSECASVVCLNRPGAQRLGSVGKPLAHCQVQIDEGGEILVAGPHYLGYLGEPPAAAGSYRTGDLGFIDAEGFVHITGRKRDVLITALGRNISPEWIEAELTAQPAIAQAFVGGEGQLGLSAILVASGVGVDLAGAVAQVNAHLPDYAQINSWRAAAPFSSVPGLLTSNGRLRRSALSEHFAVAQAANAAPLPNQASQSKANQGAFNELS